MCIIDSSYPYNSNLAKEMFIVLARLRPTLEELEAAERDLDIEGMVQAAVDGIERIRI